MLFVRPTIGLGKNFRDFRQAFGHLQAEIRNRPLLTKNPISISTIYIQNDRLIQKKIFGPKIVQERIEYSRLMMKRAIEEAKMENPAHPQMIFRAYLSKLAYFELPVEVGDFFKIINGQMLFPLHYSNTTLALLIIKIEYIATSTPNMNSFSPKTSSSESSLAHEFSIMSITVTIASARLKKMGNKSNCSQMGGLSPNTHLSSNIIKSMTQSILLNYS